MGPPGDVPELWGLQAMGPNYGASRRWAPLRHPRYAPEKCYYISIMIAIFFHGLRRQEMMKIAEFVIIDLHDFQAVKIS